MDQIVTATSPTGGRRPARIPIGNNAAQGRLAERRFQLDRSVVEMAALQQDIIAQVRIAVRALEDGAAAVEAAISSQQLAARNLEAEQTKFDNGLSTNYQVLQIQEDLAQAELTLIRTYLDYRKANIGYRYATGTLLDFLEVGIVDPGQPDVPNDYWKDIEWLQFDDFAGPAGNAAPAAERTPPRNRQPLPVSRDEPQTQVAAPTYRAGRDQGRSTTASTQARGPAPNAGRVQSVRDREGACGNGLLAASTASEDAVLGCHHGALRAPRLLRNGARARDLRCRPPRHPG
jgi:hypothetical protein